MTPGAPPSSSLRRIAGAVGAGTLLGLLAITVVPPGSTRVFSSPWSLVYAATLVGPALMLALRAFDFSRPLALPSRAWQFAAIGAAVVVLASAAASPYRPIVLRWSAPYLSAVAVFFLACDGVASARGERRNARGAGWGVFSAYFLIVGLAGIAEWTMTARQSSFGHLATLRNPFPLGHSNYTAGLALLMLPIFGVLAAPASLRGHEPRLTDRRNLGRLMGAIGTVVALVLLLTSASRAAVIAVGVMIAVAVAMSPLRRALKARRFALGAIGLIALVLAHPRTRAMFGPAAQDAPPNISNVQRSAMLHVGSQMGADRPSLGWGAGSTPLVFPRYRATVDGGAENVLQLHSLPVQLWAELGLAGLALAGLAVVLALRDRHGDRIAAVTLAGYAVFSLFDAQLDVPAFGFSIAVLLGFVAAPNGASTTGAKATLVGCLTLFAVAAVVLGGRPDRTPALNSAALSPDIGRREPHRAIELLTASLVLNPDQEIAHFNLGWLTVVSDPAGAATHFEAAAHLVPDKGGVYFGLGLARLNAGNPKGAAHALALEMLNDPVFLLSPWWDRPEVAALRPAALIELETMEDTLARSISTNSWTGRELKYVRALNAWIAGTGSVEAVRDAADTKARQTFFRDRPKPDVIRAIPLQTLQRERVGYPVLMRNLDIPPPIDLWVIQESGARRSALAALWPDKGWLPSPLLIKLLGHDPVQRH